MSRNDYSLTKAQISVLQLYADGCNGKAAAMRLGLSKRTVEHHRANLIAKMNANTISHAVALALRNKIIVSSGLQKSY